MKNRTWHEKRTAQGNRARRAATELTSRTAAAKLRAAAKKYLADGKRIFKGDEDGLDTMKYDYEDLMFIAGRIAVNDKRSAYHTASHLETAVREEIPPAVWVYMGGKLLY